jgi:thiol-disulfide isomerase/thioredoxin
MDQESQDDEFDSHAGEEMTAGPKRLVIPVLLLAGIVALFWMAARIGSGSAGGPAGGSSPAPAVRPLEPSRKVTFLELGSVGCKPCEEMKPVMEAVRQRFPDEVEVIFHDVRRDPSIAARYRISLIPTQIFLLPDGAEFFRHEGFFSEGEVTAVLLKMGVRG